jgi:hypothetical protein
MGQIGPLYGRLLNCLPAVSYRTKAFLHFSAGVYYVYRETGLEVREVTAIYM